MQDQHSSMRCRDMGTDIHWKKKVGDRGKNRPYSFPGAAVTTVTNGGACNNRNIFCPGCGVYVWIAGGKAVLPLSIGRESFLPSLLAFFDSRAHPPISVSVTAKSFLCVSPLPPGNLLSTSISEFFSSSCKDTSHLGFRAHRTPWHWFLFIALPSVSVSRWLTWLNWEPVPYTRQGHLVHHGRLPPKLPAVIRSLHPEWLHRLLLASDSSWITCQEKLVRK